MLPEIRLPDYLPDQNQLYAFYLSRCGTYHVGRPNHFVLKMLDEDVPAHYKRLKFEAKQRQLENWIDLEEIEGDNEAERLHRIEMTPLAKKKIFRVGNGLEKVHLGSRGMMALLDLIAELPLLEEADFSNIASWYIDDAFPLQCEYRGNDVLYRLCEVALRSPSLKRINIFDQPIGTLAANQLVELCQKNPRITDIIYTRNGVDNRLCRQLDGILERNKNKIMEPPIIQEQLPSYILDLPRIDRKTLREQQILRGILESDENFMGVLNEEEMQRLVLHTRTMTTSEVVTRCSGRGLRGDGEHLFVIKSGRLRAYTDLVGFTLQKRDYFGEKFEEVLFSTCSIKEELRGIVYAIPLQFCRPIVESWEDRLVDFYPQFSKAPLLQPLSTWCRIRVCTCATQHSFSPGEVVIPAGDGNAAIWMVHSGNFFALAGAEDDIDRTGRFDPFPFHPSDVFGIESLVARKKCSSIPIIAGKEKETYSAIRITGTGLRIITEQLCQVLVSLVRPYSVHEDMGAIAYKMDADDIKVHRI